MSPLSDTPRPILFRLKRGPDAAIVMEEGALFKQSLGTLTKKLEEYAAKRPQIEQLAKDNIERIMFDIKTDIIVKLWQKGKISIHTFGKQEGKPDKYDPANLQEAFMQIINELNVDL